MPAQCLHQLLDVALAADQLAGPFRQVGLHGRGEAQRGLDLRLRVGVKGRDEAVTESMHGLDAARVPAVVAQRASQLRDEAVERARRDEAVAPHGIEQLVAAAQLAGVGQEFQQHGEGLGFDGHFLSIASQAMRSGIDHHVRKREPAGCIRICGNAVVPHDAELHPISSCRRVTAKSRDFLTEPS
ncbi:hypothetical protein [Rhodanobacter sp. DHB23]|uniref:hypothetical protein n=1 Tax=Rhodanobacter sp. DHB23 TaxID=2775923 RepID=UPI0021068562|nr:hypothetical protein [Rhodanobacter sp. DHB23]